MARRSSLYGPPDYGNYPMGGGMGEGSFPEYQVADGGGARGPSPFGDWLSGASDWREQNPGVLTQIGAGLMSGDLATGFQNASALQTKARERQRLVKALMDRGLARTPEEALLLAENPSLVKTFNPGLDGGTQYGQTPQYFRKPDGSLGIGVLGDDGTMKEVDAPGELLGPYGVANERALGTYGGKLTAEAAAALPGAVVTAQQAVKAIDELLPEGSGLDEVIGPYEQYRPTVFSSSKGNEARAKVEQLKGQTFLQAYATLKGGGAITEVEGAKAEQAIARLQTYQDEATYRQALRDLREVIAKGIGVAQSKAGVQADPSVIPSATDTAPDFSQMTDEQLREYIGGQ